MSEIFYERFISQIYDDSPFFGQSRTRETDKFNQMYYDNLTDTSQRILEFGSNTGTLSIPLARRGFKLDCLDISPYMQEVLSEKLESESPEVVANINQIVDDATTFKGPELYDSVIMPEGIIIAIPDRELQLELLRSCHRNLKVGGRIYTDYFQPDYDYIARADVHEYTRFKTRKGETYLMEVSISMDKYTQIQDYTCIYTKVENGEPTEEKIVLDIQFRYIHYSEITLMLEMCGFKIIDIDVNYADARGFGVIAEKV